VEKAGGVEDFDLEADILEFELQDVVRVKSMFIDIFIPARKKTTYLKNSWTYTYHSHQQVASGAHLGKLTLRLRVDFMEAWVSKA
jgi:hypothetical protein